jgi:hypothetical protein
MMLRRCLSTARRPVLPKVIFGTSTLGNLFAEPSHADKKAVVSEIMKRSVGTPMFDSAGYANWFLPFDQFADM